MRVFLVVLLPGCAGMGPQIDGWPELTVYEHHVPHAQMRAQCTQYSRFALSCAQVSFTEGRCDIWFSAERPPSAYVQRHERLHCAGHDHEEDDTLRAALTRHRMQRATLALQP